MRSRMLALFVVPAMVAALLVALPSSEAAGAAGCDPEYVSVSGSRIFVSPTGVDDTANLQCALDTAAAMPRGHVLLATGDFFTSFLGVEGLYGSVRGAGSDATHIYSLPEGLDCPGHYAATGETAMLTFGGGDFLLEGFSIGIGGEHVCAAPWMSIDNPDGTGLRDGGIEAVLVMPHLPVPGVCPTPLPTALRVVDLAVDGDIFIDLDSPIEVWDGLSHGVLVAPWHQTLDPCLGVRLVGDVVVQNSRFEQVVLAVATVTVDDSAIRVIGNEFVDTYWAVALPELSGSHALVSRNDMDVIWTGLLGIVADFPGDEPARIDVRDNTILARDIADGIVMIDYAGEVVGQPLIDATIVGNEIEMVDTPYTGIFALGDTGGLIARNQIYGTGAIGIGIVADSWKVIANDLTGLDSWDADVLVAGNENRIVCHSADDEVLDLGLGNKVIGCTLLEAGAAIATGDRAQFEAGYSPRGANLWTEYGW